MRIKSFNQLPFKIGTTSMVFGEDFLYNVRLLKGLVDHIEILLFHTPSLNNIPGSHEIEILKNIGQQENVTFSVHLPASLEIASTEKGKREESVRLLNEICLKTAQINPLYYILHIPFTPPTLVPVPGLYFTTDHSQGWDEWTNRAMESLEMIHEGMGNGIQLLVENINYSPFFLEPFWKQGQCQLCLDIGHLMLGQEKVMDSLKQYLNIAGEIHLHGVIGYKEHLSLSVLPEMRVRKWLNYLIRSSFKGIMLLELFSPRDLEESIDIVLETLSSGIGE